MASYGIKVVKTLLGDNKNEHKDEVLSVHEEGERQNQNNQNLKNGVPKRTYIVCSSFLF